MQKCQESCGLLFFPEASLIGEAVVSSWSVGLPLLHKKLSFHRLFPDSSHLFSREVSQHAAPWWQSRQSIVILRACLNNNPPPLCHFRWQHPLVSWRNHCNYPLFPSISSLHFIANICHCPPLCCRSIPFGDLTGASTVPASCGDWWLRGSNVQVWLVLSRIT